MIDEALGQPREAQLAAQYAEFQKFNVEAQKAAAQRSAEAQAEQERQRLNQQRAAAVQQRQKDDLDVANKAYQDAKVDPDRFYKNRSTGANILSSIGVALGAFGASLNHTPNFALESVNKAIDNDMESQKEEIKKLGARSQNQLQQMRDATGSNEAADNAFRIASLQYAQSKAAEVDTTGKGAALQKMFGDEIQRTKLANALHRENTEKYVAPQMIGGGGAAAGADEKDLSRELQLPDEMAGMPAGTRLIAKDAKSADQLRTIVGGYSVLKGLADKAAALQAKYGADIYVEGSTGWNAMVALRTNALSQAGHVNAVARQPIIDTEEMKEQLTPHLYNALGVGPSVADRWTATVDAYGTSATSILRTHAPEVDHRYIGRTPSGRIVPQAEYTGDTPMPHAMPRAFKPITGSGGRNPRTVDQRPDVRAIPEPKPKGQSRGGGRGHNPPPSERETDDEADEADGEEP
jgi:hypothetical protein